MRECNNGFYGLQLQTDATISLYRGKARLQLRCGFQDVAYPILIFIDEVGKFIICVTVTSFEASLQNFCIYFFLSRTPMSSLISTLTLPTKDFFELLLCCFSRLKVHRGRAAVTGSRCPGPEQGCSVAPMKRSDQSKL